MSRDLNLLIPEFKDKVLKLIENCQKRNVKMTPFFTVRTPTQQATLWKQGRTDTEVKNAVTKLKTAGATGLSMILERAPVQNGRIVTQALPGSSWHNYGEAVDCFWDHNGKAIWSDKELINGINGYEIYAEEARKLNMNSGFYWTRFKDSPHVQMRDTSSPLNIWNWIEIEFEMKKRFPNMLG